MNYDYEKIADDFLELASQQRLGILLRLLDKKSKVSIIAKDLDATVPEVYRNFDRLVKANLIVKDADGDYSITTYGKMICGQIPSLTFLSQNKTYFRNHDFGDLPQKFLQRIGALENGQHIKGFVKVLEQWKNIYKNSNEYICDILFEVSYDSDLLEPLVKNVNKGVKVKSIFSESAIIPKERKQALEKLGFKKLIEQGLIERKMRNNVQVAVILNEKEACVTFPKFGGELDMSEMFYSDDSAFHEWCLDYFKYCWDNSSVFQESKLKHE
ncbi:transcriptional regulator [Candidatus Pacearchaeota archaeon]|nr:transcriptional regulator [Candidatus Pacearchaeota archaeon]